jgi:hypothetical protein
MRMMMRRMARPRMQASTMIHHGMGGGSSRDTDGETGVETDKLRT